MKSKHMAWSCICFCYIILILIIGITHKVRIIFHKVSFLCVSFHCVCNKYLKQIMFNIIDGLFSVSMPFSINDRAARQTATNRDNLVLASLQAETTTG